MLVNSRIHRFPCREDRREVQMVAFRQPRRRDDRSRLFSSRVLPNGSRLSCGRNAQWRKAVERQIKGWPARQRNSSLLVSARQLQAHVRQPLGNHVEVTLLQMPRGPFASNATSVSSGEGNLQPGGVLSCSDVALPDENHERRIAQRYWSR